MAEETGNVVSDVPEPECDREDTWETHSGFVVAMNKELYDQLTAYRQVEAPEPTLGERFADFGYRVETVRKDIEDLASMAPAAIEAASQLGIPFVLNFADIAQQLLNLCTPTVEAPVAAEEPDPKARKRNTEFCYKLVWANGETVTGADGNEFVFRNRIMMLRSPRYAFLMDRASELRLVDTRTNEVIVEHLTVTLVRPGMPKS